jgi:hypothetical protein
MEYTILSSYGALHVVEWNLIPIALNFKLKALILPLIKKLAPNCLVAKHYCS